MTSPFDIDAPEGRAEYIAHMLQELETPLRPLSRWEEEFLPSIADQFERNGSLSDKQFDNLQRIYAEKGE